MAVSTPLLELQNGSVVFGGGALSRITTVAVDNVSFQFHEQPPRILSMVGESGSGKTTIARCLLGLAEPTGGRVLWRGKDICRLSSDEFRTYRREVQAVFQDPYGIYNPYYRVDRVFDVAIRKFGLASSPAKSRELVFDALRAVDLRPDDTLGRYPHQLSGGERQRIMLARAYLLRPKVIIADEPISMLDAAVRTLFMNILLDFKEQYGVSTLFITHDLSTAYYLGGDILVMEHGRAIEAGSVDSVMDHPAHPYTQLLLQSVPRPDPRQRWEDAPPPITWRRPATVERPAPQRRNSCLFADRCPYVMEVCRQARPRLFRLADQQAACHLHAETAV
ncbi:MAG TPA: ABC transporter ATP-binding protein [Chloroflexota bacterium]|nr:ABC transporter ATP-binding protein [Chloroflexota bacterium]